MLKSGFKIYLRLLLLAGLIVLAGCRRAMEIDGNASQASQTPSLVIKLTTRERGLYSVSIKDLQQAGVEIGTFEQDEIHLTANGEEQSFWLDQTGSSVQLSFYARALDNIYSEENVYWLALGGATIPESSSCLQPDLSPADQLPPTKIDLPGGAYTEYLLLEENRHYQPQASGGDHWFSDNLAAPGSMRVGFELDNLSPGNGSAHLTLVVWSNTEASASPDHQLGIQINGHSILEELWEGKGRHTLQASFSSQWLAQGDNELVIQAAGTPGVIADIYYLDKIEIAYPRMPVAQKDVLDFWKTDGSIQMSGFSGEIQIYDITDENTVLRVANYQTGDVVFEGDTGKHYLAVGPLGAHKPEKITFPNLIPDLRASNISGDYLAIGPQDLLEPLQPLLDWRAEQGLKVMGVPLDAVYDQFSCGVPVPQAIQALVDYAAHNWLVKPRYLLLVGDSSYDPKGFISDPAINRLPTFLVDTVFGGETASDVGFVQINDDPWPDLPIGRFPARTPAQIESIVEKILAYEQNQGAFSQVMAIADGQEASFRQDAQTFLDLFPPEYPGELFAPQAGEASANRQTIELLGQDHLLVAYFGHGSVSMWGKDRLFTVDDVSALPATEQLPVVINMTCLTGLFTHPEVESLAEALLWQPGAGAVAVLAPSSLTLPADQSFLSQPFARALVAEPGLTLGELHQSARRQVVLDSPGAFDVMQTFMLFGDPALKLPEPAP